MFTARIIDANEAMAVFGLVRLCYPEIELAVLYLIAAVVLFVRPAGLFGRA